MGAGRERYEAEAWFQLGSSLICVPGLTCIRAHWAHPLEQRGCDDCPRPAASVFGGYTGTTLTLSAGLRGDDKATL